MDDCFCRGILWEGHEMANQTHNTKTGALVGLLRRINQGENPMLLAKEAGQLIRNVGPEDIASAEQDLVDGGCPARLAHQLSAALVFVGLRESVSRDREGRLPDNHIIRRVMTEHDLFRGLIADLEDVTEEVANIENLTDVSSEFRRLADIVARLSTAIEHIEREEDVIFPYVRKHCWKELPHTAHEEHMNIAVCLDDLIRLVTSFNDIPRSSFKTSLAWAVRRLSPMMLDHFSGEDEFLWPIALAVIDDPAVWEKTKALCDEIGYWGFRL